MQNVVIIGGGNVAMDLLRFLVKDDAGFEESDIADPAVEAVLFKRPEPAMVRPTPDWGAVAVEMRRRGVTLQLLWQEYRDRHPDGYSYSQFRRRYRAQQRLSGEPRMRRTPAPAAMCEVDYAGQTVAVATPCWPAPVSAMMRRLPMRFASSTCPSTLLILCAPVWFSSSRLK